MRVRADLENLDQLLGIVRSILDESGCQAGVATSVEMACEEAIVNVMNYAYDKDLEPDPYIELISEYDSQDKQLTIVIQDRGRPFNPLKDNPKTLDLDSSAEERDIGGLGIYFIQKVMDELHYEYTPEGINSFSFKKQL